MDRMQAIEKTTEALQLLREGGHNARHAGELLTQAIEQLDYSTFAEDLNTTERKLLNFLKDWPGVRAPTYARIAEGCGFRSRSYARDIAISLENKGYVVRAAGRARSLQVVKQHSGVGDEDG